MGKHKGKQDEQWAEAKRRCRLSDEEIRMAKELGLAPRGLIKNIPARSQPWKAPVNEWIRRLHAERFGDGRAARDDMPEKASLWGSGPEIPFDSPDDDLIPQWDTVSEEEYFVRKRDGKILSVEEAGRYLIERDATGRLEDEPPIDDLDDEIFEDFDDDSEPMQAEVDDENLRMVRRQKQFRVAANAVAAAMSQLHDVERVVLFGSVARPLEREVPRFRKFRRAGCEICHECRDVDLAVWVNRLDSLKALQKARSRALNELWTSRNIGVAHHQVDVFLMEPGTDRYLGRLCVFGQCPKGKEECRIEGCGEIPFVRKHEEFVFDWGSASRGSVVLYDRCRGGAGH